LYQKVSIDSRCRSPHSTLSWFLRMMEWGKSVVKNTKKRVSNNWPKLSSTNRVFGEREREKTFRAAKEDDGLKLLRNQKESVRHIFDSYCKKILRQENAGMKRSEVRRRAREYSLSELPPELFEKLRYEDVHPMVFEVCGYRIPVNDDRLAAALAALLREKRDVILLSYFMDMSDREIGELLDMARRTVQHRRTDTLAELRKRMEDGDD